MHCMLCAVYHSGFAAQLGCITVEPRTAPSPTPTRRGQFTAARRWRAWRRAYITLVGSGRDLVDGQVPALQALLIRLSRTDLTKNEREFDLYSCSHSGRGQQDLHRHAQGGLDSTAAYSGGDFTYSFIPTLSGSLSASGMKQARNKVMLAYSTSAQQSGSRVNIQPL